MTEMSKAADSSSYL